MMFEPQRMALVAEAESWLRTPHHHQGRRKGAYDLPNPEDRGGVDCLMFVAESFANCGFIDRLPDIEYAQDEHLHRGDEVVLEWMERYSHPINRQQLLPADIIIYKYGRRFSHGAIALPPGWPRIIHAVQDRCVEYGRADQVSSRGHRPSAMAFYRLNAWRED